MFPGWIATGVWIIEISRRLHNLWSGRWCQLFVRSLVHVVFLLAGICFRSPDNIAALPSSCGNNSDMSLVLQLIMCSQESPAHTPRAMLVGAACWWEQHHSLLFFCKMPASTGSFLFDYKDGGEHHLDPPHAYPRAIWSSLDLFNVSLVPAWVSSKESSQD